MSNRNFCLVAVRITSVFEEVIPFDTSEDVLEDIPNSDLTSRSKMKEHLITYKMLNLTALDEIQQNILELRKLKTENHELLGKLKEKEDDVLASAQNRIYPFSHGFVETVKQLTEAQVTLKTFVEINHKQSFEISNLKRTVEESQINVEKISALTNEKDELNKLYEQEKQNLKRSVEQIEVERNEIKKLKGDMEAEKKLYIESRKSLKEGQEEIQKLKLEIQAEQEVSRKTHIKLAAISKIVNNKVVNFKP